MPQTGILDVRVQLRPDGGNLTASVGWRLKWKSLISLTPVVVTARSTRMMFDNLPLSMRCVSETYDEWIPSVGMVLRWLSLSSRMNIWRPEREKQRGDCDDCASLATYSQVKPVGGGTMADCVVTWSDGHNVVARPRLKAHMKSVEGSRDEVKTPTMICDCESSMRNSMIMLMMKRVARSGLWKSVREKAMDVIQLTTICLTFTRFWNNQVHEWRTTTTMTWRTQPLCLTD